MPHTSKERQIGVTDIFDVPGDFSFPINNAICLSEEMRWIGCTNEINAAYADGCARVRRVGAVCTTYGVGELSAINGIAGSYAERLPVFHLVAMPNQSTQEARALMHHTLGNGAYEFFYQMTEAVVCVDALRETNTACVLPGFLLARAGQPTAATPLLQLIERIGQGRAPDTRKRERE